MTANSLHSGECQLGVEPFYQCCCNCKNLLPVHFHCCTNPKPTEEQKEAAKLVGWDGGRCVCGIQKGWACVNPEMGGRVVDRHPFHSCGCECYDPKDASLGGNPERHAPAIAG